MGYRDPVPLEVQLEAASKVKGLRGVGLDYPYQFQDPVKLKEHLANVGLELWTVELGLYPDRKWKLGAFTAPDSAIRREAIEMCKEGLDAAVEAGATDVLLWPGQDGFDYPFQADYQDAWKRLIDGIIQVAEHRDDIPIAIEYKPKEPRIRLYVSTVGAALYLTQKIDKPHVGVAIDLGHSLMAGENPGEAVALLARESRLFQVHVNDNYSDWDHDMLVGSVSFWMTLEFFCWLQRVGYDGWYGIDVFPYREDGSQALCQSIHNTERMLELADRLLDLDLPAAQAQADALKASQLVWDAVLK
jgi:xylose isomerase